MEQEDRKKKLAAGKEKLAAFRKKRAKKKKTATGSETDNGEGPAQQESLHSAQTSANGVDDTNELTLSDLNSFTGDSDQYSLTSGDEWSGEESELHAAVHYQTKLLAATDRIAELEETVEGKQLALDRMSMELQLSNSPQKNVEDRLAEQETANGVSGMPSELEDALLQRDKIIRQLTARLQETAGLKSLSTSIEEPDYLQETQRLSQQVVMLQQQLAQAGETVHQQVAMCQMSVRALQDAKTQILALQDKVTEKNDLLQDLSLSLNSRSSEVEALKQREAELERLVGELSQQAAKDGNRKSGPVQPADSQLHALEEELGRLGSEHAQSQKTMDELKQRLSLSETSRQALINEKEEALGRIMGLEEELNQLGHVKDEALTKMSELEHKVHESAALLQTEYMGRHEAGARIAQLERELNAKQSVEVAQLSQTHSSSQASPADSAGSPQGLSDLKNVINSQQGELLSLRHQLQSAEAKLSSSREEAVMLREQLEKLQNQDNVEQAETSAIILDLQQEVDSLSSENDRYQKQAVMMEQQVNSFKDLLKPLSSLPVSDAMQEQGASVLAIFNLDQLESEPDITKRMQALHRAYAHLMSEYTQTLEKNQHLVTEVRAASEAASDAEENGKDMQHLAAVVARLQTEADEWKTLVQDKDTELEKMNNQLKEVMNEKEQIVSGVRLQEEMTELKTLDSDTLQRKMETRINTLFSEVSEYKEALKESEAANMELQEKLDQQTTEADSLKMQLEANEDLMKEQQGKASADDNDILTRLQQAEAELQVALEDSKVVVHLRADLEEKNLQLQAVQRAKELAEEETRVKHSKHEEDLKAVQLQLAGILEQHQAVLTEQEHLVTSHREEILRLEDNLQHKTTELESMMNEKDQTAALLVTLQEQKTQEVQKICSELDQKSHELHDIVAEKEHILTEMKTVSEDREADIQKVQVQLEEKSREVEKLWADLASVKADKESEIDVQLLEKTKEAEQVIAEKEHLLATFQSADTDRNQQLQDLQVKLDQKNEECQTLLSEKEELANQLSFHRSASSEQLTNLHEKLQQKGQECEIIWAENERHREELQSQSAISMKETQRLKQDLEQQTQRFQILLSDWESLDTDLHSRESAFRSSLQKNQQKLQEAATELEEVKGQLLSVTETANEKDGTVKNLHTEVEQLKERLTVAQAAGDEASQQTQQTLQTLQSRVHELEQEVNSKREENDTLMSRLAGQADMFKVKEEEMVAENNVLNHQLEEARNDAKETTSQLERERDDLQEQLDTAKSSLQDDLKETRRECDTRVKSLQLEIDQIQQEHGRQMTDLETEIFHLNDKNKSLQDQLDSCATEIEELQQKLKGSVAEKEQVEADKERLVRQQESMQLDFTSQLELAQSQIAAKDSELQALQTQVEESAAQQKDLIQALQEEVAAAQSEIVQKESDLASATDKLKFVTEEKEMLKNNFDCCMEEMTQRANDRDDTIRHLQSRLAEACQNVDRDQGQLRELYESQLSEFEDRLATADLEVQRLEKVAESVNTEKDKLKESFNGQIAELELALQAAESQSSRLKEQMSKMAESHEKDIDDLKHSHEIQIGSLEEHCQSLEKALSKQDALMAEANSKFERDRAERERAYEQQLSDAYEQGRMHELDVSRVKRQMDEMRKDHQKEKQALEKSKETEIFDLENKCVIATTELERLRKSLWGMENDYSGETQALHNRIQELEAVSHSQEKQISDLQDRLMQSSEKLDDSVVTLRESYQSEVGHIEELNQRLSEDVERLQEQLKTTQRTHAQEMEALKHQHNTDVSVVQERCRQAENYSHVLQSHMDNASPSSENHPEVYILRAEAERLQQELVASETSVARLQQKLKEEQASSQSKLSDLKSKVEGLTSDKDAKESRIQHLTEDLENEKQMLHESQMICQDLEEENKQLSAENTSLHELSPPPESRFVSSEEDGAVAELKQTINHLTQEMQRIQTARNREKDAGTAAEGGFEPEPDSLEYLDLATEPKASEDFFVEETEGSKSPVQSPAKMRTKSVPSVTFMGMEIESAHIMQRTVLQSLDTVNMSGLTPSSDAVVHGFQPESPVTQYPATGAPNLSFLPLNVGVLSEQTNTENKFVELVDSGSQTERTYAESIVQESVSDHAESLMQPQKAEHPGETLQNAGDSGENMAEDGEADFAERLKGVQDQLEEEWVLKMRSQEVELRHSYDEEFREFQRRTEHQCQQQIQQVKQETQASFVDAVRKMRKSLERKQKQTLALKDKVMAKGSKGDSDVPDGPDGENLGEIVKQLHEENQELAEVRDVLLKEIDISQTRGRHNTMQHELSGKMSPSQSLKLSSGVDSGSLPIADPAAQQTEAQQLVASHSHTATAMHADKDDDDDTNKDSTPTAGSDDDDEGSEGSCVRDRFLEELEEMSQQSGQDLPLEWELTSTTVSHGSTSGAGGASVFERDQMGSSSVWEVFDGRCLRQDCREVRHRYNNLFRWLSRVCSLPDAQEEGGVAGQGGTGVGLDLGGKEDGEQQGEGWVEAGTDELDSVFYNQVFPGGEASLGAMLTNATRGDCEPGQDEGENIQPFVQELLSRLLSLETHNINLEQRMSGHTQLFDEEREELQLRGDSLQSKCHQLECSKDSLVKQVAGLEERCRMLQVEKEGVASVDNETMTDVTLYPQDLSASLGDKDSVDEAAAELSESLQKVESLQDTCNSLQHELNCLEKDKVSLEQQLSIVQETGFALQEENSILQEKEEMFGAKCALLAEEVQTLEKDGKVLREELTVMQKSKEELTVRCYQLARELEATADYQAVVQKKDALMTKCNALEEQISAAWEEASNLRRENQTLREKNENVTSGQDTLQAKCSSLEKQLAVAEEDLSKLHSQNQNLEEEKQVLNAKQEELREKCAHLGKLEDKGVSLEKQLGAAQENLAELRSENQNLLDAKQMLVTKDNDLMEKNDEIKELRNKNSFLEEQMLAADKALSQLLSENEKLQQECQGYQQMVEEKAALQARCKVLEEQVVAVEKDVSSLRHENHKLLQETQILITKNKQLEGRNEQVEKIQLQGKEALTSNRETVHERDTLKTACSSLEQQLTTINKDVTRLRHENQLLAEEKQKLEVKCRDLTREKERLEEFESKCRDLTREKERLEEFESKCRDLTREKERLEEFESKCRDLTREKERLEEFESKCRDLTREKERLEEFESKCRDLTREKERLEEFESKCSFLEDQLTAAQGVISRLRTENETASKEKQAPSEYQRVHRAKEAADRKCSTLEKDLASVQADMTRLRHENRSLLEEKQAFSSRTSELTEKDKLLQDAESKCSFLEDQIAGAHQINSKLQQENQILLKEKQELHAECRKLKEKSIQLDKAENRCKALDDRCKTLQERNALLESTSDLGRTQSTVEAKYVSSRIPVATPTKTPWSSNSSISLEEHKILQNKVKNLQEENRSLQEKIDVLEESNRSLKDRCDAEQERNNLLQNKTQSHDNDSNSLQGELQFVKDNLQAAEAMNNSLLNKVRTLEASRDMDGNLQEKNKALHEKCAGLTRENKAHTVELREADKALKQSKGKCKLLEDKCRALKDELQEATQSGESLREQLHEQSMTLERVISEMRESSHESTPDGADMNTDGGLEEKKVLLQQQQENVESPHVEDGVESQFVESEEDLRQQVSKLEQALSEKEDLIAELKEQMTLLSLQQAAVGSPRAKREATKDLEQDVQELREDLIEKDNIIQDLQEQEKCLKQALSELRRKVKEDSDLDQEVSILHQALFEKEKVIQELKETSKLLQLSQHEKPQAAKKPSSRGQTPSIDRQERMIPEDRARSQLTAQGRRSTARSERSVESTESLAVSVSSDQDSDISPGQDVDIVKEMRRLRKDIKKTKAVYANESALFQEALDREPVSYIGLRSSRSPSLTFDFAEMTHDDIPDDPDQLKRMVVKLLEENKSLTTENLRLQLRIREQEALVVEMEERLPVNNPPEEWQSLFERQLLLLQKQRDELLHQVFERDSGVGLLSSKMGKEVVGGAALHQQQEDLTAKIGELEHCHKLLQQRQAELAHCQAEKRQLEQLLLLKDETERQLMRQKRLLEEELSTIEGKLQEREATLVEEKARLMRELKERDQHIFQLQTSHIGHFREPGDYPLPPVLMGRPQSASTPRVEARSQSMGEYRLGGRTLSAEAFFMQPPVSQAQELLSYPAPHEQGAQGGSFVDEVNFDPASIQSEPQGAMSRSFQDKETKPGVSAGSSDKGLTSRRHSTGSGRFLPTPIPKDPEEMYKYHRDAVERLRDKLQLEVEMAMLSEGQAAAISGYWQRHNRQVP